MIFYNGKKYQRYYENQSGYIDWSEYVRTFKKKQDWLRLENISQLENEYQQLLLNNKRRERLKRILK